MKEFELFFEELIQILVGPEPIKVRAEKALAQLLDFDFRGDPGGEVGKLWVSLMSDINQTVVGPEELDPRWAEAVIQKILKLLWLTHEVSSPAHLIEVTNTKISKAPVLQSDALPWKPTPVGRFRHVRRIVVNNVVNPFRFWIIPGLFP